jgi:hypothetical protein
MEVQDSITAWMNGQVHPQRQERSSTDRVDSVGIHAGIHSPPDLTAN